MVYNFGLLPDFLMIWSGDYGTVQLQSFGASLPRDGGFAPGTFRTGDFVPLSQAVQYYGVNWSHYGADVGPYAGSSVTLQLSSVDPYPVDKNLYGLRQAIPFTHGTLQAVLVGGPYVENDAGVVIPQDASVTLTASF